MIISGEQLDPVAFCVEGFNDPPKLLRLFRVYACALVFLYAIKEF